MTISLIEILLTGSFLLCSLILFHAATALIFTPALDIRDYDIHLLARVFKEPGTLFVYGITIIVHILISLLVSIFYSVPNCQSKISDVAMICLVPALICLSTRLINFTRMISSSSSRQEAGISSHNTLLWFYFKHDLVEPFLGHTANTLVLFIGALLGLQFFRLNLSVLFCSY